MIQTTSPRNEGELRIVINAVSWETYERLTKEKQGSGVRISYDRGSMEIMAPLLIHERYKNLLGLMIGILAEYFELPFISGGATTLRKPEDLKGLEGDECFWIQNADKIIGRADIDLAKDPPPDLAIEIDITSSSLDKLGIYASIGVTELWRYDGQVLQVGLLQSDGKYKTTDASEIFPSVPLASLVKFLERWDETDDGTFIRNFRKWVSETIKR